AWHSFKARQYQRDLQSKPACTGAASFCVVSVTVCIVEDVDEQAMRAVDAPRCETAKGRTAGAQLYGVWATDRDRPALLGLGGWRGLIIYADVPGSGICVHQPHPCDLAAE